MKALTILMAGWFQTTALKWELSVDMGDTDFSKSGPCHRKASERTMSP